MHTPTSPKKNQPGGITRFEKNQSAATQGISLGLIKATYANAIEYSARTPGMHGMVMLFGLLCPALAFYFAYLFLSPHVRNGNFGGLAMMAVVFSTIFVLIGIYAGVKFTRLELFQPEDQPTIFDRKNRKVYRIFQEVHGGWRGLFRRWPMKMAEYDWDLIDAEHHAAITTTGSTVSRSHALIFLVRRSHTDPTVVDAFSVASGILMGEVTTPAFWEHIRRFMEEDGPHLPPGEELRQLSKPTSFWQCMARTGPYGKNFRNWWRDHTALMIVALIFFPVVLPIMTLLGIFSWMAYKTSFPAEWSPAVMAAVSGHAHTASKAGGGGGGMARLCMTRRRHGISIAPADCLCDGLVQRKAMDAHVLTDSKSFLNKQTPLPVTKAVNANFMLQESSVPGLASD